MTEQQIMDELNLIAEYIRKTFSEHYAQPDGLQTTDIWRSLGSLETTARDTAIKYLMRYGRKDGRNLKDLYKAIHYIMLMIVEYRAIQQRQQ